MNNWGGLIEAFSKRYYNSSVATHPGLAPAVFRVLENEVPFTEELRSFYQFSDGVSCPYGEESAWIVLPAGQILEAKRKLEKVYLQARPELWGQFYPLIDWATGDFTGLLLDDFGKIREGLYTFEFEEFHLNEYAESDDVFSWNYESLSDFFLT